jgi:putative ABC transport system permease protein
LLGNSLIEGVTASQDILGSHLDQTGVTFRPHDGPAQNLGTTLLVVDTNYLSLYHMKLLYGSNFSGDTAKDARQYIVNESLAHELLKDHPNRPLSSLIGEHFGFDSLGTIVAVAKNFNFNTLHYKVEPLFIISARKFGFSNVSIKINGSRASEAIAFIKSKWSSVNPDNPIEYLFLDDHFNEIYRADQQKSQIVGILSGLAILISCLGLFGLASYSAEKRVKEIGVRKVLGASVKRIVLLLSMNFLVLVLIANAIAIPLAGLVMHKWLQDFAYRIDLSWIVFAAVLLVSVIIALVTISFQAIKAATANPVKSLRSE